VFESSDIHSQGHLNVGDGHAIYWEESGTPDGCPALYLHGGPGGTLGTSAYRTKFDPQRFRLIGFDQRGCGRSTPHVTTPGYNLDANTTATLLRDIERLREHLGVERWLVSGVSWGSTLAVAYAQAHPKRVRGVVLVAVTTTSHFEVEWITESMTTIFPEAWDQLATFAESTDAGYDRRNGRVVDAYARLLRHPDPAVRNAASWEWVRWEDQHVSIGSGGKSDPRWNDEDFRLGFATLVTHYWANDGFLDPPLLDRTDRLRGIPATLIHGRRDVSGPMMVAWQLHREWPDSTLIVHETEGHGGAAMSESWADATTAFADLT
jgi:proline iminopeptidase